MDLENIKRISLKEKKTLTERMLKLQEELGELAQEILINQNASGFAHKKSGQDGIIGESIDVILVALSIYFIAGGDINTLNEKLDKKCQKWQEKQT
jgi:NTP pyrophosphatase (non-canonical NTP hydrolase)